MENLPNELLIDILLKTESKNELIKLCKSSKRLYNLCKTETVAKHIIKNLIKLDKPDVFLTYKGLLKHYIQHAKNVHLDTLKYDTKNFYKNFPNPRDINKFRERFS
jgi:hypothetical protein